MTIVMAIEDGRMVMIRPAPARPGVRQSRFRDMVASGAHTLESAGVLGQQVTITILEDE